jgi:hypothetical protein
MQNFAHKDAAYVLSYSVIMLNTDQHNGQVRAQAPRNWTAESLSCGSCLCVGRQVVLEQAMYSQLSSESSKQATVCFQAEGLQTGLPCAALPVHLPIFIDMSYSWSKPVQIPTPQSFSL